MPLSNVIRSAESIRIGQRLLARSLRPRWRTRFAPAPTGFLHLGHVVNAVHVWGVARAHGGSVILRVEDHDRTRCRPNFEDALLNDLDWLGFAPDIGTTDDFRTHQTGLRQSNNAERYNAVLRELSELGFEYGCTCTRKDIAEIVGDQFGAEPPYPGTCSNANHSTAIARRFRTDKTAETFDDIRLGPQIQIPQLQCGDFLVRDRNGNFTYQFCVTVDDCDQVTDVVIRGEDLLSSTGRQLQLARVLGRKNSPQFLHHALLRRSDGLKLSKSLGDTGVREMRDAGWSRQEVLGEAAFASGLTEYRVKLDQSDLSNLFS